MNIDTQLNFIRIHIPKTAGTSLQKLFGTPSNSNVMGLHSTIYECKQYCEDHNISFDDIYKFTVVRNPWDRMVSLYKYKKSRAVIKIPSHMTFTQFVTEYTNFKKHPMARPQVVYTDIDGHNVMDCVAKFESLKQDLQHICSRIKVHGELIHTNKTKHKHYTEYYNKQTIKIIQDAYSLDIERFNYTFDS